MFATLNRNLLKSIMLFDGVFSLATASLLFAFSGPLSGLVGPLVTPGILLAFAVFFVFWGGFHLAVGRQEQPSPAAVRFAIIGDALWVLGSVAVLVLGHGSLTAVGMGLIAVAAVAVADIMLIKQIGLGRQRKALLA
ncbi:hypothetical protein [Shinella sp. M27]|uniref:hypothetical protein n=1 Tax=Shinella sp. M27 TaxID=3368614 RepID=UPI003B9FC936